MKVTKLHFLIALALILILAPTTYSQDKDQTEYNYELARAQYFAQHEENDDCFDRGHAHYFAQLEEENQNDMAFPNADKKFDQSKRKYLEQLRVLKLLELLDLDEDQDIEFVRLYRQHRKEVKKIDKKHFKKVKDLSEGLKDGSISEVKITQLSSDIIEISDERSAIHRSFLNESKEILTPVQFGKLVVFKERFERELLEQVREFRNQERFGPGHGRRGMGNGKQKTFDFENK